jgi:hypothetical protein
MILPLLAAAVIALTPPPPATPAYTPTPGSATGLEFFPTTAPNFECPNGLPVNYGIATPDALWNSLCGQCLPTAVPLEYTDYLNTPTIVPTQTNTPLPGGTLQLLSVTENIVNPNGQPGQASHVVCTNMSSDSIMCHLTGSNTDNHAIYSYGVDQLIRVLDTTTPHHVYVSWDFYTPPNGIGQYTWLVQNTESTRDRKIGQLEFDIMASGQNISFSPRTVGTGTMSFDGYFCISTTGFMPCGTTQPTPTLIPSYCSTIPLNGSGTTPGEAHFDSWVNIDRSQYQCFVIPGFSVGNLAEGLAWVLPSDFMEWAYSANVPGITVCSFTVSITNINFFGITLDLGYLASIILAAFVIHHFTTK